VARTRRECTYRGEKKLVKKKKEGESEKTYHVAVEWSDTRRASWWKRKGGNGDTRIVEGTGRRGRQGRKVKAL